MKYQKIGLAVLAGLLFFGFGIFLGFGCNNSVLPAATAPQAQTSSPEIGQESLAPEQVLKNFQTALVKGEIDVALQQVHPSGQEKMKEILQQLKGINKLGEFANSLSGELTLQEAGESLAFYELKVEKDGTTSSFPITFIKEKDQWKISGF
ncbi:MAG: DUF4878 domain-containing protein [bacterium]|nr:DUF4878 domain-containing protein [bacterium]